MHCWNKSLGNCTGKPGWGKSFLIWAEKCRKQKPDMPEIMLLK